MGADQLLDLYLLDPGPRPIPIYNTVVELSGLNIKKARKIVDDAPASILTQVPETQAQALKLQLEASGASLELRPAGAPGAETDLI